MKVKLSGLITDIRGLLGGAVASKNKQGNYFKTHVIPSDILTVARNANRNFFVFLVDNWNASPATYKNSYASVAGTYVFTDSLGNPYTPSAFQLYIYLNMNIQCFAPGSTVAFPQPYSLVSAPLVTYGAFSIAGATFNITSNSISSSNEYISIAISQQFNSSVQRNHFPCKFITFESSVTILPHNLFSLIQSAMIYPLTPEKVFNIRTRKIHRLYGLVSNYQNDIITIGA